MDSGRADTVNGCDRWGDRLSEYLDGELSAAEREELEAHLPACAACPEGLSGLREVVARARTLEDKAPAEDLWPAIEARLTPRTAGARPRGGTIVSGPAWWGRRFDLGLPQLAAAAVLLVLFSAGAAWLALRGPALPGAAGPRGPVPAGTVADGSRAAPGRPAQAPGVAPRSPAGSPIEAATASADRGNPRYDAAVAELEQTLEAGRGKLDPRTLKVVEHNLRIIDRAIEDAHRAIAADPGNTWLRSHLAATMKRKIDLLRSATMLAAAQG